MEFGPCPDILDPNIEIEGHATYNMIKSEKLNVYTIEQTKVALSNFDDKRYILNDGYTSLAHGHYRIIG